MPVAGSKSFSRFVVLSAVSFGLNLLLTMLFHEVLTIPERFAYLPTIVMLTLFNFFACRKFVYTDAGGTLLQQFRGFVTTIAIFRIVEYGVYFTFVDLLLVDYRATILIVAPLFAAAKYVWLKVNVFKPTQAADAR